MSILPNDAGYTLAVIPIEFVETQITDRVGTGRLALDYGISGQGCVPSETVKGVPHENGPLWHLSVYMTVHVGVIKVTARVGV